MEHLAELRNRLINSLVAFCVAMIAAFAVAGPIFNFLAAPLAELLVENGQKPELIFTGLQQGFMTQVRHLDLRRLRPRLPGDRLPAVALRRAGPLPAARRRPSCRSSIASPVLFLIGAPSPSMW